MQNYIKIEDWLVRSEEISNTELRVFMTLATYADKSTGDNCYPSQSTIAKAVGKTRETVNRALGRLEKLGFIEVARTKKGNKYKILKGAVFCDVMPTSHGDADVTTDVMPTSHHHVMPTSHNHKPIYHKPNTNISPCSPPSDPPDDVAEESPPPARPKPQKKIQPHSWEPQDMPEEFLEFGREQEFPDKQIIHEYQRFSAYWAARKSEKRPGWLASWRSWLRKCEPNTYRFGSVWRSQDLIDGENRVKIKFYLEHGIPRSEWPPAVLAWERFDEIRQEYRAKQVLEKAA